MQAGPPGRTASQLQPDSRTAANKNKLNRGLSILVRYQLNFERDEDGRYVAECADLPGCLSEGETLEEAMENISEAIIGCLKSMFKVAGQNLKTQSILRPYP
jgi:predicted RNase H-like HicB family nuclease